MPDAFIVVNDKIATLVTYPGCPGAGVDHYIGTCDEDASTPPSRRSKP